jgi:hypothetical protein
MKSTVERLIVETWAASRTRAVLGTLVIMAAGCADAEPELTTNTGELICTGPNCVCSSTFGIGFVQGTDGAGTHKNFELAVPHTGGGFSAYWRNNDLPANVPSHEWRGPTTISTGDINGISLIENKGMPAAVSGLGNLEVVVVRNNTLVHFWRDDATKVWSSGTNIPGSAGIVTGQPGFVQNDAFHKNFEVVVPRTQGAGGGLVHFWRNNQNTNFQWSGPNVIPSATGTFDAVSLIESDYDVNRLELVARSGTQLVHIWREGDTNWSSALAINPDNTGGPIMATGVPSFTQRQAAPPNHGNFELVVPLAGGGLRHFFRDNTILRVPTDPDPFYHWFASNTWLDQTNTLYSAAAVITSSFNSPLNAVGRRDGDGALAAFFYDEGSNSWQAKGNDTNGQPLWAGAVFGGEPCCNRITKGEWQNPMNSGAIGIHAALLKTGKVLFFGFGNNSHEGYSEIFDPNNPTNPIQLPNGPVVPHAFCAGQAFLNDGKLWVAGGHESHVADSHVFDPDAATWLHHPETGLGEEDNGEGRWYPTLARRPDGSVFAISGAQHANRLGALISGVPNAVNNTYQLLGPTVGTTLGSLGPRFDIETTFAGDTIKLYPFVFQLPNGQLFVHSLTASRLLTLTSEGPSWGPEITTNYQYSRIYPGSGSAVLLPLSPPNYQAKIMLIGGGGAVSQSGPAPDSDANIPATSSVELLDLGAPNPDWTDNPMIVRPMNHARVLATAVLLPDGKVFVAGGSTHGSSDNAPKPVMIPEIYDPAANTWTEMCPMRVARLYHSTALLLPDARVLTAGRDDDFNMTPYTWPERRVEIFSPPYLTSGNLRPGIQTVTDMSSTDAGVQWGYNQNFTLTVSSAVAAEIIPRVVLMSPGAVTHAFDMSQRAIVLTAGGSGSTIQGSTPLNSSVAPPGWYMLFAVSNQGVPSIATWVQLR